MSVEKPKKPKFRSGSLPDRLLKLLEESLELGALELAQRLNTTTATVRDLTFQLRKQKLITRSPVTYRLSGDGLIMVTETKKREAAKKEKA